MNDNNIDFEIFGVTGYTVMANYHFRDKRLSFKAKGLLSTMLSLPKDWKYSIKGLIKLSRDGKDSVRSGLDELKDTEYLIIERYKDKKGMFRYKYRIYYIPYPMWLKTMDLSKYGNSDLDIVNPDMDLPDTENPTLLNNINNKKDKKDIMQDLSYLNNEEHNILTKELINRNYITSDDGSSFLFDDFFNKLLEEHSYKDLFVMTDYILKRLKEKKFKDEDGNKITNKFGYFKNALLSNISKFENMPDELYEGNEIFNYDWLNDDEKIEEDYEL